ncbi:MAG: hypothetical protein ACI4SH_03460 [Candidatus Scatosoma sp.]
MQQNTEKFKVSNKERRTMLILAILFAVITLISIPLKNSFEEKANDVYAKLSGTAAYFEMYVSMLNVAMVIGAIVAVLSAVSFFLLKKVQLNVGDESVSGTVCLGFVFFPGFTLKYAEIKAVSKKQGKLIIQTRAGKKYYCAIEDADKAIDLIQAKI